MKSVRALEPFVVAPGDDRNLGFNFTNAITLPANTTITSVTSVTVVNVPIGSAAIESPALLTVENEAVNTATYEEEIIQNGELAGTRTVAIGKAVKADVSAGTAAKNYDVRIVVGLSTGESIEGVWPVWVRQ